MVPGAVCTAGVDPSVSNYIEGLCWIHQSKYTMVLECFVHGNRMPTLPIDFVVVVLYLPVITTR